MWPYAHTTIMVDLPLGKALITALSPITCDYECVKDENFICPQQADCCKGCYFDQSKGRQYASEVCGALACDKANRRDGRKVIYKVVEIHDDNFHHG